MTGGSKKSAFKATRDAIEARLLKLKAQFDSLFPTDDACLQRLFDVAVAAGAIFCPCCARTDPERLYGRIAKCRGCNKKWSFTAGTFFARMRNVRAWSAGLWLTEQGVALSSCRFHKLMGISQSSALNILRRIRLVIQTVLRTKSDLVSSALFKGAICKRSRETPEREHPSAEENPYVDPKTTDPGVIDADLIAGMFGKTAKIIFELLSEDPLTVDEICILSGLPASDVASMLTILELAGFAKRSGGDRYVLGVASKKAPKSVTVAPKKEITEGHWSIRSMIRFVHNKFHGVSRKYLQTYLAAYRCYTSRSDWSSGKLMAACFEFAPISYEQILCFVTAPMVEICQLDEWAAVVSKY